MSRALFSLMLLAVVPGLVRADERPEALLSAHTQVYLRWDGADAHRAVRDKSALGKTLREDAGTFLTSLVPQLLESFARTETTRLLKQGIGASRLISAQADAVRAPRLGALLARHGFLFVAEARPGLLPDVRATFILPGAGPDPGPFFSTLRLIASSNGLQVKSGQFAGRSVQYLAFTTDPPAAHSQGRKPNKRPVVTAAPGTPQVAWWVEGRHAVVSVGMASPEGLVQRFQENGPRLPQNPLFQKVQAFKEFETGVRGFVDVAHLVKVGGSLGPVVRQSLDAWGLSGFRSAVLYMGFEGQFTRTRMELEMPPPRRGILQIFGGKPFSLADLPPLPADAQQFMMLNLNPAAVLDAVQRSFDKQPGGASIYQEALEAVNEALDINVRTDVLGCLGDRVVVYLSPADGVLFGQVALLEVKDQRKLTAGLDRALKSLAIGGSVRVKKHAFRGVDMRQVYLKGATGFPFVPTVAVYKKWLVLGFSPQGVEGFILRAKGELPSWKPEPQVEAALARLPKRFTLVSVSDPRPMIRQVLTLLPLIISVSSAFPGNQEPVLDVGTLPNAHLAVKHLFPNTMAWTDDGRRVRIDSYGSLDMPLGFTGLDSYGILLLSFLLRFGT